MTQVASEDSRVCFDVRNLDRERFHLGIPLVTPTLVLPGGSG